jgi:putative peptidoglycan lipid II flippase
VTVDPFGEGGENDQTVLNVIDGDVGTFWQTETYLDPFPLLKPGVGLSVRVLGVPRRLQVVQLSPGTAFEVLWATSRFDDPGSWERVAGAHAPPSSVSLDLPPRQDGYWLIWLTELAVTEDGSHQSALAELRFQP